MTGFIGQEKTALGALERGIRISGPPLGRPPAYVSPQTKKQAKQDEKLRNSIEGKFGQVKRRFSLSRVMAKLTHTSETAIAITFLVMNLSTWLRRVFCAFLYQFSHTNLFRASQIIKNYLWAGISPYQVIYLVA